MKEALFTKSLTVAMSPDVYEKIKKFTDEEKISMAEWVRDAVEKALPDYKKKEESNNEQ